ncbi:hypothetical protein Y032_0516g2791 [Ancylostoma ceylanicum]|uniref:Uncharacterized protein n=1 Tax=Ancylostoma ceylanicum TaxID=53326 RepID=A0A016WT74_9BILA|nr:hypothetical protein Y032_0516g2791 [Ancylostoma ceylanicum]
MIRWNPTSLKYLLNLLQAWTTLSPLFMRSNQRNGRMAAMKGKMAATGKRCRWRFYSKHYAVWAAFVLHSYQS